ncbi:carbohydrate deacetylase [Paenibacillus hodogayensis]|uniref:Carbohydrate deacetylase n=1 Tax=Paenibacillus hodogayensis TaxID=279208 RepID=A0ABV5VS73_9BACL
MTRYVIVNADDFGLSDRVNEAIRIAHTRGLVSSTSLLPNMPGFLHAVALARKIPTLGVGLHVNLTIGKALSPKETVASLVNPDGTFSDRRREWREDEIERELGLQYGKLTSAGLLPTHLDSHHHIHLEVPAVHSAMRKLGRLHRIPVRLHPWAERDPEDPRTTDFLILDTFDTIDGVERLLAHLQSLPEGCTEIMCHPSAPDTRMPSRFAWQAEQSTELGALTDPRVLEAARHPSVALIHFGQLPSERQATAEADSPETNAAVSFVDESTASGTSADDINLPPVSPDKAASRHLRFARTSKRKRSKRSSRKRRAGKSFRPLQKNRPPLSPGRRKPHRSRAGRRKPSADRSVRR